MRIALISDIHGNIVALDAVLADCRTMGVEQYWFLGDYAAIGPEPAAVLERLAGLDNALFSRGNTDRYVVTRDRPGPDPAAVQANPALLPLYAEVEASFAWTRGFITAAGWFDWLAALPLELRMTAPDGTRLLGVHAAPKTDDGPGIHPGLSNAELAALLDGADADVLFVGHTHEAMVRRVDAAFVVNLGSVSNPKPPDLDATYVVLEADQDGTTIEHRRVRYERHEFRKRVDQSRHPATEFILSYQRGEQPGHAAHADHTPFRFGQKTRVGRP